MKKLFLHLLASVYLRRVGMLAAALGWALASGCASHPTAQVPDFVPTNHAGDAALPAGLHRVVLLPVAGGTIAPVESMAALDAVFAAALQQQQRFEVVPLSREDCRRYFHAEALDSVAALPANFMAVLRREFGADAVLFVDVTVFQPYHALALGLRAKLAMVDDVRLVWTFDTVFSADDPAVANGLRSHYLEADRGGVPPEASQEAFQSPRRFAAYAAAVMFATLPPVPAPPGAAPRAAAGAKHR